MRLQTNVVAALCLTVMTALPCAAQHARPALRDTDERLARRVNISDGCIIIGDLAARLSAQSGVSITADDRDGAADLVVAAFVRNAPVGDVMDGLRSLLSYRQAEWSWVVSGAAGMRAYRLVRPITARQFGRQIAERVRSDFEKDMDALERAARMSPVNRRAFLESYLRPSGSRARDRDRTAETAAKWSANSMQWSAVQLFTRALTSEQQKAVLANGEPVTVHSNQLSAADQALAAPVAGRSTVVVTGGAPGVDIQVGIPADEIRFSSENEHNLLAVPLLSVEAGPGRLVCSGVGNTKFARWITDAWTLPGDLHDSPHSADACVPPRTAASSEAPGRRYGLEQHSHELRLQQLASGCAITVLARVDSEQAHDPGAPFGLTAAQFLRKMTDIAYLSKWQSDTLLLVSARNWFRDEDGIVQWRLVQQLRRDRDANRGLLPLNTLAMAAAALNRKQLVSLSREFPVMKKVAQVQGLVALLARPEFAAGLSSERGLPLAQALPALKDLLSVDQLKHQLEAGSIQSVRLVTLADHEGDVQTRRYLFQFLDTDGKPHSGIGFEDRGVPLARK